MTTGRLWRDLSVSLSAPESWTVTPVTTQPTRVLPRTTIGRAVAVQPCKAIAHGPCSLEASPESPYPLGPTSWTALSGPLLPRTNAWRTAQQMRSWLMRQRLARLVVKMDAAPVAVAMLPP
jgi:hypothetical protein